MGYQFQNVLVHPLGRNIAVGLEQRPSIGLDAGEALVVPFYGFVCRPNGELGGRIGLARHFVL